MKLHRIYTVMNILFLSTCCVDVYAQSVSWWVSTRDGNQQLTEQEPLSIGKIRTGVRARISVNPDKGYQRMLGLGSSFEHSTCYNISLLSPAEQDTIIEKLVSPTDGIGMNLMRICMGTPDFTKEKWYSYCDVAAGETDAELKNFSIDKDKAYVIPVLKKALAKNPKLLYFASPWSPPGWMKDSGVMMGGSLKPEYYAAYAQYFVKFIQAYEAEGVPIYAVTVQNEPAYSPKEYPSCHWTGEQQRDFIRDHLGPAFAASGIHAKIWCWDHNFNLLSFPQTILRDAAAARFVEGTGFHHYEGRPEAMTTLHEEFPDKSIHFTEGSVFGLRGANQLVSFFRNWTQSYTGWVILLDEERKPNNGPHHASETCIVLNTKDKSLQYNFDYFMYGQFMKFIDRDAVRIASEGTKGSPVCVAFKNPDGAVVVVAVNSSAKPVECSVCIGRQCVTPMLPAESVTTLRWASAP